MVYEKFTLRGLGDASGKVLISGYLFLRAPAAAALPLPMIELINQQRREVSIKFLRHGLQGFQIAVFGFREHLAAIDRLRLLIFVIEPVLQDRSHIAPAFPLGRGYSFAFAAGFSYSDGKFD